MDWNLGDILISAPRQDTEDQSCSNHHPRDLFKACGTYEVDNSSQEGFGATVRYLDENYLVPCNNKSQIQHYYTVETVCQWGAL